MKYTEELTKKILTRTISSGCICCMSAFIFIMFSFSLFYVPKTCNAVEPAAKIEKKEDINEEKFNLGNFEYKSEGRRDPFEPLYLLRMKQDRAVKATKKGGVVGISKRGYELEELKLVGILKADKNFYAMMEDTQGKGIIFKKGDFMNKNLWVLDILDNGVILGYRLKTEIKKIEINIPKK